MNESNVGRRPAMVLFYIFLIAPFFQLELLQNLIPIMGKAYTLWQLLAGAAFFTVWYRGGGKLRDFTRIHLLFLAESKQVVHQLGYDVVVCGDEYR